MSLVIVYLCLAAAILTEVIATTALAASEGLSKPLPSIISVVCFVAAFWLLAFPLRTMPTGIVYAIWSGLGIVLITAVAWVWAKQPLAAGTRRHRPDHRGRDRHERVLEIRPPLTRTARQDVNRRGRGASRRGRGDVRVCLPSPGRAIR